MSETKTRAKRAAKTPPPPPEARHDPPNTWRDIGGKLRCRWCGEHRTHLPHPCRVFNHKGDMWPTACPPGCTEDHSDQRKERI